MTPEELDAVNRMLAALETIQAATQRKAATE